MDTGLSKKLYKMVFNLSNRMMTVTLKNGREVTGVFISFCYDDKDWDELKLTKLHLVNSEYKMTLGIDPFGFLIGEYIRLGDIDSIKLLDDNSIFKIDS